LVHIRGQARSEQTLHSPVTRTPCYLYKVVVEEWHSDSEGGHSWKHLATDFQCVKFYLEDSSDNALVDATDAELDLPQLVQREARSGGFGVSKNPNAQAPAAHHATDDEILEYVGQARVRHASQLVGKGIAMISHANDSSRPSQRPAFLDFLMNPSESGAA